MAPQYILDRYRIIEKAGSGGYGSVYHAFDTHLKRDVAIKCIELSETDVARARIVATEERMREELGAFPVADELFEGAFDEDDFPEDPAFLDTRDGLPAQQLNVIGAAAGKASSPENKGEVAPDVDPFDHIPGLKEARMVAKLSDASIVTVHECIVENSTAHIIMEYIEGKTLAQIMRETDDALSLDVTAAVFSKVAQALSVAHENGILHLDIKPDNVLINSKGHVKVTDFGLATLADANGRATTGGGTIGYMPLEQMRLQPLDARTDQWALGALTYEMLTGENPFRTQSLKEAQRLIEDSELVLPSLCWDELPAEVDDVVFTAMDLEPEARFKSISAFAEALLPYLGDPKAGQRQLAQLVKGVAQVKAEPQPEPASLEPATPIVDRIGPRGASILLRAIAALGAALACAVGLANIHLIDGSAFGLATDMMPLFAGLTVACAVLALIKPHLGALIGLACVGVALMANGAFVLGLAYFAILIGWWYVLGRDDEAAPTVALLQPLLGSIGLAAMVPVTAGALLSVSRAAASALFATFLAMTFASFGSGTLLGWNVIGNFSFMTADVQANFLAIVTEPHTWCVAVSWVVAAAAFSFFCLRGTRAFDIAGAVLAAALLLFGICAGIGLDMFGSTWQPAISDFAGAIIPGIAGIAAAVIGMPDRARWDEGEWERYLTGPQTIE